MIKPKSLSKSIVSHYPFRTSNTIKINTWNMLSVLEMFVDCVLRSLFSVLGWFIVYNI